MIEINGTLRISKAQEFPALLDIKRHFITRCNLTDMDGEIFTFHSKPRIQLDQQIPVRTFLVEEIDGK